MDLLIDIGNKIGFDWRLAITHLINFLIIYFLLVKYALPAIKKTVDERKRKIEEGLKMREDADKIVAKAQNDSKKIAQDANQKVSEIISKGEISAKQIILDANEKANQTIQSAEKEKLEAKNLGLKEAEEFVQRDIAKILTKISSNAFSSKITADINSDFISDTFSELATKK